MLILWVVTLVFYGIMAVCFFSLFWVKGAELLAVGCGWLIRFVLAVTRALAAFPLAAVYTKSLYIVAWLVLCYGLLTIFLAFRRRQPYVLICCGTIGLCVALLCSWLEPLTDDMRLTMLDVGQGQSLILQSDGKTFLIDCGGYRAEDAADLAAETLLSQGITRLDGLILTHYDRDHAGGVEYLLSRIPAERVYLPDAPDTDETMEGILSAAADKAFFVTSDQILTWQETAVTVFAPLLQGDDNESGLCILFEKENCDILITGDLSSYGESLLCAYTDLPQLTLLVAGHHGSKYSASETLLSATTPEYAFISVGENSYGHPAAETLERLLAAGCKIYRTDLSGTIIFRR
jgi:competence protein ComEC